MRDRKPAEVRNIQLLGEFGGQSQECAKLLDTNPEPDHIQNCKEDQIFPYEEAQIAVKSGSEDNNGAETTLESLKNRTCRK